MKLTINLDVSSYGQDATEADRDEAVQWMREVAELLGMEYPYIWYSDTDDAQEIWTSGSEDPDEDKDVSEWAFIRWCSLDTPAQAAEKIKGG